MDTAVSRQGKEEMKQLSSPGKWKRKKARSKSGGVLLNMGLSLSFEHTRPESMIVAQDRADLMFAINDVCHFMFEPHTSSRQVLEKIGRRVVQMFRWGSMFGHVEGYGE